MQLADAFEPEQQAAEFVLPAEHTLNGVEPLLENRLVEKWPAAAFSGFPASGIGVYVRHHAAVENRLPVTPAIVDAVEAHDRALKIEINGIRDPRHLWKRFTEERRFIVIAGRRYERRNHITISITKGDDLVAFDLLVPAESDVIAALLRRCRRAITVDHRGVQEIGLMKRQHGSGEDRIETAIRLPPAKDTPDAGMVNLPATLLVLFDRQFFPLAS